MRIAMDTREAKNLRPTGKGLFAAHILKELMRRGILIEEVAGEGGLLWHLRKARAIRKSKPHLYLSPTSFIVPWLLGRQIKTAIVIHDLIAFDNEPPNHSLTARVQGTAHDRKAMIIERTLLPRVLKTARWIFCVSEATKKELLQRFPNTDESKIAVIYEGSTISSKPSNLQTPVLRNLCKTPFVTPGRVTLPARRSPPEADEDGSSPSPFGGAQDKLREGVSKGGHDRATQGDTFCRTSLSNVEASKPPNLLSILSIGTLCPRKNQLRLVQAFNALPEALRSETKLILAGGRGWQDEEIVELAKKSQNVEWRSYVPKQELEELFTHATVLAYPSFKEGFGLPVLDAMTLGIPVLTSNVSSMPEVAGDAAVLVDPGSVEDIAKGLQRLLLDADLRSSLIAKGKVQAERFSWERTVDIMMKTMQER